VQLPVVRWWSGSGLHRSGVPPAPTRHPVTAAYEAKEGAGVLARRQHPSHLRLGKSQISETRTTGATGS
jgi:hypothetical protein